MKATRFSCSLLGTLLCVFGLYISATCSSAVTHEEAPEVKYSLRRTLIKHRPISRVEFTCNYTKCANTRCRETVFWYLNGALKHQLQYDSSKDNSRSVLHLTESEFVQRGFSIGNTISCSVSTLLNGTNHTSLVSAGFFVGIKILTPIKSIELGETDTSKSTVISLQSTIPIGCSGTDTCSIWLTTYNPYHKENMSCSVKRPERRDTCGFVLQSNHSGTIDIPIKVFEDGVFASFGDYEIALKTETTAENDIWRDYALPIIKVHIAARRTKDYIDAMCFNMFRVTTFDGRTFQLVTGVFTLYKHLQYETEVQIKASPIDVDGNRVISTCGVAIKAGIHVYTVDYCGTDFNVSSTNPPVKTLSVHKEACNTSMVCFPYGTCVHVSGWRKTGADKGVVVSILSSPADWNGSTRGLCGTYNNNCFDDFRYRLGHGSDRDPILQNGPCSSSHNITPAVFVNNWRVDSSINNYITNQYNKTSLSTWTHKLCICQRARGTFMSQNLNNYIPCTPESVESCQ